MNDRNPVVLCLAAGWAALLVLPWYAVAPGFWSFAWIGSLGMPEAAPAFLQAALFDRPWLWPVILVLTPPLFVLGRRRDDGAAAAVLAASGAAGLAWLAIQGFSIGIRGWNFAAL